MKHLICELEINIEEKKYVSCVFNINTKMQIVTKKHKKYWIIELKMFEEYINNKIINEDKMKKHLKERKFVDVIIIFAAIIFGVIMAMLF